MHLTKSLVLSVALAGLSISAAVMANDWVHYGSDLASTKYAPFDQINHSNVSSLQLAWLWNSPDNATVAANHAAENFRTTPGAYKSTPIAINGVLYISTSFGRVAAIDGVSGEELWVFDTRSWEAGRPANLGYNHRGVGYWSEGGQERIIMLSNDAWMWSIDAKTGELDTSFGDQGKVDLAEGLGKSINRQAYTMIAAPDRKSVV